MIDTTIGTLIGGKALLQNLANTSMPVRESLKVLKTLKAVENEFDTIEKAQRKLLEVYGERNEAGGFIPDQNGNVRIIAGKEQEFAQEMKELLDAKIELNCEKIPMNILERISASPSQLMKIEDFIAFDE